LLQAAAARIMKTTIDIAAPLLHQARALAEREGTTLEELVERGLALVLAKGESASRFQLRDASVGGDGIRTELDDSSWLRLPGVLGREHEQ